MKELDPKNFLQNYNGASVDFYRFPGNYGDSLIWHGTKILLSTLGISKHCVETESPQFNNTLFIDGGGNFIDYYHDVRDFLVKKSELYEDIIILPHTIFGEKQIEILNDIHGNLTVFCRERVSANFLQQRLTHGNLYLWHDCAFYNIFAQTPGGTGVLRAFRTDTESLLLAQPESNNDLSYDGYAKKPLDGLFETIKRYERVDTDRLHIAIGATLLGKQVRLFPNSYYKNKAVFDYSLKRYPNISFVEDLNNL